MMANRLTEAQRNMVRTALLEKAASLRMAASGRPDKKESDALRELADEYSKLAATVYSLTFPALQEITADAP